MARSRNIKPGFFANDQLAELPPVTRLLFIALWTLADREGRIEDRPKRIKAEALPYDECDVHHALQTLDNAGFIQRYSVGNTRAIQIVNWHKHQNPHMKEAESTIPAPDEHKTSTVQAPDEQQPKPALARLIPDSLNLRTTLSGKPDLAPPDSPPDPPNGHRTEADILGYLNEKTGRDYQPVRANIDLIAARLKDGASPDDLRAVIDRKCAQWAGNDKMSGYLRPATLFNATKFAQYSGERDAPDSNHMPGRIPI